MAVILLSKGASAKYRLEGVNLIIVLVLSHSFSKKMENYQWLHTVTDLVLIMSEILSDPSTEKSEGVYASIPGYQESLLSSDEYKAMYDYVAQVSVFVLMFQFYMTHLYVLIPAHCTDNQLTDFFCSCLGGR